MNNTIIGYRIFRTYFVEHNFSRYYPLYIGVTTKWEHFPNWGNAMCYCNHRPSCVLSQAKGTIPAINHREVNCACSLAYPECGFYAFSALELAKEVFVAPRVGLNQRVIGRVELAGQVDIHEKGYIATKGGILDIL